MTDTDETRTMNCPYVPRPSHDDECDICGGAGTIEVRDRPPSIRLLPSIIGRDVP